MQDNIIPADVGWSINYDRFSDVGRRRLEYELCMNLCIGWQYQLCKSPPSHGWCEYTGGKSDYQNKHGKQERKFPSKKTGCQCRLTIKCYPGTDVILGKYKDEHDHLLSDENLRFLQPSARLETW